MAEPALTIFGANASQDATTLTITKADLPGLTASASNTAESLVTGVILQLATALTEAAQEADPDQQITVVEGIIPSIVLRNGSNYRQVTYSVNFQQLDASSGLDPDDY